MDLFGSSSFKLPKIDSHKFNDISRICLEIKNEEQKKGTAYKKR